eukprot:420285-Prymnesium_polylepis.3
MASDSVELSPDRIASRHRNSKPPSNATTANGHIASKPDAMLVMAACSPPLKHRTLRSRLRK